MVLFPSWIPWSHPRQTIPSLLQYTTNLPILTSTYSGIVSNHNLSAKYRVIGTLTHRANTVCTTPELPNEELEHLRKALVRCKYHRWAINKIQNKYMDNKWEDNGNNNTNQGEDSILGPNRGTCTEVSNNKPSKGQIVLPYVQQLGENLKKMCNRCGIQRHFKGSTTIKQMLVRPKGQGLQGLLK